jgi:hypothetical protein
MDPTTRTVTPTPQGGLACAETGEALEPPAGWVLLPPGDAALTRRVKQGGPHWVAQERRGRRTFSRGVWAPAERVERLSAALSRERATPEYARKLEASRDRRARQHEAYVVEFRRAVLDYLAFDPRHAELASRLADAVTDHATPVGSGTVARTQRIPLAKRADAAVIAWLRHQTTAYDQLDIPRVKGKRREVRRRLARRSKELLARFRAGEAADPATCPLQQALQPRAPAPARAVPTPAPKGRLWEAPLGGRRSS